MHIKHLAQSLDISNKWKPFFLFHFLVLSQFLSKYNHACFSSVKIIIFIHMNNLPFMPNDV